MSNYLKHIQESSESGQKLLAVLIDPDKFDIETNNIPLSQLQYRGVTHVFIGGSEVSSDRMKMVVHFLKEQTDLPLILFPGDPDQICEEANAILFLSLLSGRNPEYLIGKQVEAASVLYNSELEIIPTAYLLIDGGNLSSIERVTGTKPLSDQMDVLKTALAGQFLGMELIYLEAGSGASHPIDPALISLVKSHLKVPLIVGGGIRSSSQLKLAFENGADMVVMGNIFESNPEILSEVEGVMNSYAGNY